MTDVRTFEGIDTVTPVLIAPGLDDGARSLIAALKAAIEGEVRFDAGSRAAYSTDSSNYRQVRSALSSRRPSTTWSPR